MQTVWSKKSVSIKVQVDLDWEKVQINRREDSKPVRVMRAVHKYTWFQLVYRRVKAADRTTNSPRVYQNKKDCSALARCGQPCGTILIALKKRKSIFCRKQRHIEVFISLEANLRDMLSSPKDRSWLRFLSRVPSIVRNLKKTWFRPSTF